MMPGSRPPGGCWITTSTPPPALRICWPARPAAPPARRPGPRRPRSRSWPAGDRRWGGARPGGPARRPGRPARVIALAAGLAALLRIDGPLDEAVTRHAAAVQAARQLGDRPGQALALANLGNTRRVADDSPGAVRDLQEALSIYRDLGDRPGQANVLI